MLPVLLLGFSATALRPPTAPSRRGVAAAAKQKARAAGGFGAKPKPPKRPALGQAAAKLLGEHGGDVDAAQAARFDSYMEKLRASDPELFADVARARRCDPAAPARGRDRLLAMTWDTVADYLPVETADAALDARLARVAAFARGRCPVSYTHLTLPTIYSV